MPSPSPFSPSPSAADAVPTSCTKASASILLFTGYVFVCFKREGRRRPASFYVFFSCVFYVYVFFWGRAREVCFFGGEREGNLFFWGGEGGKKKAAAHRHAHSCTKASASISFYVLFFFPKGEEIDQQAHVHRCLSPHDNNHPCFHANPHPDFDDNSRDTAKTKTTIYERKNDSRDIAQSLIITADVHPRRLMNGSTTTHVT